MNTTVVILAAGLGTRMRSKRAKVLHRVGGRALVEHVLAAAKTITDPANIVVVTGHEAAQVEELLAPQGVSFVRQQSQKGTGDALASCRAKLENAGGTLMLLYGDVPLLAPETLQRLKATQESSGAAAILITTTLADPTGYGRVIVDDKQRVTAIVEHKNCTPAQRGIHVINSGIYCFKADTLWLHLGEIQPNPESGEYYLTDMAEILTRHGHLVTAMHIPDPDELLGINTKVELADADRVLRERKCRELMLAGVTIERPETVTIDVDVRVGADTVIEPYARLLGSTEIGEDCRVGAGAIIQSCTLQPGSAVEPYTIMNRSNLASGSQVGPFARLRFDVNVQQDAKIGNFVELKAATIGKGSKAQHLAYLGDTVVGEDSNIGAGTITCNYDGEKKHPTKIGDRAFVGTNSTLVAPLEIGNEAYIAAGSVITDNVPAEALAFGRERQVNKPGRAKKLKKH
jgi:bifunctional UDP-N-acetylglucosamine pyrophosphorylase / glucosamine-1-phosphate N-acetyltransferase